MENNIDEQDHYEVELFDITQEYIGQYKKRHEKEKQPQYYHLYALDHLCRYATSIGLNSEWIYKAFMNELDSKSKTMLRHYYLGSFVSCLIDYGSNTNQAISETAYWISSSEAKVDSAYRSFLKLSGGYTPSSFMILFDKQKLKTASAFNNSILKPFPESKGKTLAEHAYYKMVEDIEKYNFTNEILPYNNC